MAAQKIQQAVIYLLRVAQAQEAEEAVKGDQVDPFPHEKVQGQVAEEVVHHRVKLVAPEPGPAVAPDLAYQVGLRVNGFNRPPEFHPKVAFDFVGDVQPPAVNAVTCPVLGNAQEVAADQRVRFPKLGQLGKVPPAGVVGAGFRPDGQVVDVIPVQVRGFPAPLANVGKGPELVAGMVEDSVQDQANARFVQFPQKAAKGRLVPKERVDFQVIPGVVAVVGRGGKDGIEPDGVYPQFLQVPDALPYPLQVAAEETCPAGSCSPGLYSRRVVGRVPVGKAVGENLVENGVPYPGRGAEDTLGLPPVDEGGDGGCGGLAVPAQVKTPSAGKVGLEIIFYLTRNFFQMGLEIYGSGG